MPRSRETRRPTIRPTFCRSRTRRVAAPQVRLVADEHYRFYSTIVLVAELVVNCLHYLKALHVRDGVDEDEAVRVDVHRLDLGLLFEAGRVVHGQVVLLVVEAKVVLVVRLGYGRVVVLDKAVVDELERQR